MKRQILAAAAAALVVAGPAEAHVGVHVDGAAAGFVHPFLGLDHLAAMVAVGLWAAMLGGRARLVVPASFVAVMGFGGLVGMAGIALPAIEGAIAASVVALGLMSAFALRLPTAAAGAVVGLFALFHGAAHGAEMPALASPALYAAGFLLATALLHGAGLGLGFALRKDLPRWLAGGAIAAAGLGLLAG